MVILPGVLMGVSYADTGAWPPLGDIRWVLMGVGVVLMIVGRIIYGREANDA
jgi:hypothetical protein